MTKILINIDGKALEVDTGKTILDVCKENSIEILTMCHFDGIGDVGACRLCLVEIEGINKLLPACTTRHAPRRPQSAPHSRAAQRRPTVCPRPR